MINSKLFATLTLVIWSVVFSPHCTEHRHTETRKQIMSPAEWNEELPLSVTSHVIQNPSVDFFLRKNDLGILMDYFHSEVMLPTIQQALPSGQKTEDVSASTGRE